MSQLKDDFLLPKGCYLLSHSVGQPLKTAQQVWQQDFFAPWAEHNREPWQHWLAGIQSFNQALAKLFHSTEELFCPQTNLSSALTKLLQALAWSKTSPVILMSEIDFPSMGFAMQKSLPEDAEIRYIPAAEDVTDIEVWRRYITSEVDLAFISHAYSNTGQQAPVEKIVALCKKQHCLSLIDVAQSAGILPLNLTQVAPDFMIGSSVKWLCGGPGAAYLWVNQEQLTQCQPKDVGWFSHQNPFEFNIHNFDYHNTALRFWGGTPSVAPYVVAANAINYMAQHAGNIQQHNQSLLNTATHELAPWLYSPKQQDKRSGTLIVDLGVNTQAAMEHLAANNISVDARAHGLRISPHIYNTEADIEALVKALKPFCN